MKKKLAVLSLFVFLMLGLLPTAAQAAWKTTSQGKMYTTAGGFYTGWKDIDGNRYYFNTSNGIMYTGWKYVDKKVYFFGASGIMRTGWHKIGDYTYYFGNDGVRRTGWQNISDGKKTYRYYFTKDRGRMVTGFQNIDKQRYYFSANGRLNYGFIRLSGKVYFAKSGTGILAHDEWVNNTYYFQSDYTMAVNKLVDGKLVGSDGKFTGVVYKRGMIRENGKVYYYDASGNKKTGFVSDSGKRYYFDPLAGGALKTGGWFTVSGHSYYADANGVIAVKKFIGKKYVSTSGAMVTGWQTISGKRYYFNRNGDYLTGWQTIGTAQYYFSSKGVLATETWVTTDGYKYYVAGNGSKQFGVTKVGNYYYYLSKKLNGRMLTGWITDNGKKYYAAKKTGILCRNRFCKGTTYIYYATADCSMATGLKTIGGKKYFFTSPDAHLVTDTMRTIGSDTYFFRAKTASLPGAAVVNTWVQKLSDGTYKIVKKSELSTSGTFYFFGSNGKMVKNTIRDGYVINASGLLSEKQSTKSGWVTVSGKKRYYKNGSAASGWQTVSGLTYYMDSTGLPMTGRQVIDGKTYFFLANGRLAEGYGTLDTAGNVGGVLKLFKVNNEGVITSEKAITGSGKGYEMALNAVSYIGNPYVYGGNDINNGIDCSAFVQYIHAQAGYSISRTTYTQCVEGTAVTPTAKNLKPGDLIFYYSGPDHVVMYIGGGMVVHASNSAAYPSGGIKVSNYLYGSIYGARRIWK